jgi:hypothetical protein
LADAILNQLGDIGMDASQFADRMALIRKRFSARLPKKIEETEAAFPILTGHGGDAATAVATVYRRFHEVCGIGPTVGFNEVGRIARTLVDGVLVKPFRAERGLTTDELEKLKEGLAAFRGAARIEIHSPSTHRSI